MKTTEKLLSIIVPIYNVEKYVKDCLNSLLNQDVPSDLYEVICIDDGSPDNCAVIIDDYYKIYDNLTVIHHKNGGVSSARNRGLEIVTGKYIWFVDSDDLIANNSLSLVFEELRNQNYPDILYLGVKAFEDGIQSECRFEVLPNEQATPKFLDWMFTEIIRSKYITENNLRFDENVFFGEDDVFCVFVDQFITTIKRLNKVIYFYRQRDGSALHSAITENNFERYIKSFHSDLQYSESYDFFWYKKDGVLKFFPNVMSFIAAQSFSKGNHYIKLLKKYNMFPMKKYKGDLEKWISNEKMSGAKKIRIRACESYFRYLLLRLYSLCFTNK